MVAAVLGVMAPLGAISPAAAIPAGATVNVVIDELSPLVPAPGGTLRIAGRFVNAAPTAVRDVRIRLRLSESPVPSAEAMDAILDAPLFDAAASVPGGFDPDGYVIDVDGGSVASELNPGAEGRFAIAIPFERLPLGRPGAYALGVEAVAVTGASATPTRAGIARTFLPWIPRERVADGTVTQVRLLWLWPLADAPARTATGTLLDDATPRALAADGRLGRLVRIGGEHAVTWIADPALLQTARAISDGYQVERDGQLTVGDDPQAGARWLTALAEAVAGEPLHLLPYADLDTSAARRAGLGSDAVQAVTSAPRIARAALADAGSGTEVELAGTIAWPPGGRIDRQAASLLASTGLTATVLGPQAVRQPAAGVATLGTGAGPLTALIADPVLAGILAAPQRSAADALGARQRFLAQTALLATDEGAAAKGERPLVVVAPADLRWDPSPRLVEPLLRSVERAPWLTLTSLERATDGALASVQRAAYGDAARAQELPPTRMAAIGAQQERLAALGDILVAPAGVVEPFGMALLRAQSSAWRAQPETGAALVRSIRRELDTRIGAVRVLSEGRVVFSGDVGAVPITIANDLDQQVTVGVRLLATPSARLSSAPLEGIAIEPGRRVSVTLDARVVGSEDLAVRVQLLTPDGDPFGTPGSITVTSTAYARVASWVVAAAFAAIAVFVVVGIARRIRKARAAGRAQGPGSGPGSGTLPA